MKLAAVFSDHAVLQRDVPIPVWGWTKPRAQVKAKLGKVSAETRSGADGRFLLRLPPLPSGGPFELEVAAAGKTVRVRDVLIGEVWIASGQSNMELPMRRVSWVYPDEIAQANYPGIRYFEVPKKYNFNAPQADLSSGQWVSVDPQQVLSMSAVAYFFAKEIHQRYGVPVGIINASLGGSPIEAWLSEEALAGFPNYLNEGKRFRDSSLILSIQQADRQRTQNWYSELQQKDKGYAQPGKEWFRPVIDTQDWIKTQIPGYWNPQPLGKLCGTVWFRREIRIPDSLSGRSALLILGRIVDADSVFINGKFVGTTSYQYPPRRYPVPGNVGEDIDKK